MMFTWTIPTVVKVSHIVLLLICTFMTKTPVSIILIHLTFTLQSVCSYGLQVCKTSGYKLKILKSYKIFLISILAAYDTNALCNLVHLIEHTSSIVKFHGHTPYASSLCKSYCEMRFALCRNCIKFSQQNF